MRTGLLAALTLLLAADPRPQEPPAEPSPGGGLVTLRAYDDLTCALDFRTGQGPRVVDGELILDHVQVLYHRLAEDRLTFGFVQDQPAAYLDLGEFYVEGYTRALDDAPRLPLSVFHSLRQEGKRLLYQAENGKTRLLDATPILGTLREGLLHLRPELGHTYLFRYQTRGSGTAVPVVKFQVVDHEPGRSVTLRWQHL